jgi:S1-C subfamily serine protease
VTARGDDAWDPRDQGHGHPDFQPPGEASGTAPPGPDGPGHERDAPRGPAGVEGPEPASPFGPPSDPPGSGPARPDRSGLPAWDDVGAWGDPGDRSGELHDPEDLDELDDLDQDDLDELAELGDYGTDPGSERIGGSLLDPGALLPRDDRLWRHPSELKFEQRPAATGAPPWARIVLAAALAGAVAGAVVAGVGLRYLEPSGDGERVVERQAVLTGSVASVGDPTDLDVVSIADAARPSIVRIEVQDASEAPLSTGSGVIVRDDGHVVTNAHVVSGGAVTEAVLADGRRLDAELVGVDELTDLAVLKLQDEEPFPTALLGSTSTLEVGEPAVAIGSPLGLSGGPTVTLGVISAVGRELQASTGPRLYDLVQTDAPIMSGSSGGALLDRHGAVIGITTAVAISDTGAEGLGFAIPIEIAHAVATDLIDTGRARHGYLGIDATDLPTEHAASLGVEGGAIVAEVEAGSPADEAGLQPGDVVVEVDGEPARSMSSLIVSIRLSTPGATVLFTVLRDGTELELPVTMGERR